MHRIDTRAHAVNIIDIVNVSDIGIDIINTIGIGNSSLRKKSNTGGWWWMKMRTNNAPRDFHSKT